MLYRIFTIVMVLLLLIPDILFAEDTLSFFFTDDKNCSLKEIGYAVKSNPRIYKGRSQVDGKNCTVYVDEEEFDKEYEFCGLN